MAATGSEAAETLPYASPCAEGGEAAPTASGCSSAKRDLSAVTDDGLSAEVRRAAELINEAYAVLVIAGAGMGVDSGLDKFRSADGAYTLSDYHEKCQHELLVKDPAGAWAFHGPVLERFREAQPHEGFAHLLSICKSKASYYVCTSNVDEQFQKAGFQHSRVFNAHGSVHMWQCMNAECNSRKDPWAAGAWVPGELPQCKYCKGLARPNVSLFDDNMEKYPDSFNTRVMERQYACFENWLRQLKTMPICIIEIGCGVSEHSLRLVPKPRSRWACMSDEWEMAPLPGSLIRIDPEPTSPAPPRQRFVQIAGGAAVSLQHLAREVQTSSVSRPAVPAREAASRRSGRKAARKL